MWIGEGGLDLRGAQYLSLLVAVDAFDQQPEGEGQFCRNRSQNDRREEGCELRERNGSEAVDAVAARSENEQDAQKLGKYLELMIRQPMPKRCMTKSLSSRFMPITAVIASPEMAAVVARCDLRASESILVTPLGLRPRGDALRLPRRCGP